jgi:MscS family membrane protein
MFLFAFIVASAFAAPKPGMLPGTKEAQRPAEPEVVYDDPLGRSTPKGTVFGFVKSASQEDYDQALQYLDTKITDLAAQRLVVRLRTILERGFSGKLAMLNNRPEGALDDALPPFLESIGTVTTTSGRFDILLERVQRGNNPPVWLFSAQTLKNVPEIYRELNVRALDDYLPKFLVSNWFLWFPLWQWILILVLIPLSYGLSILVTRLLTPVLLFSLRRMLRFGLTDMGKVNRSYTHLDLRFGYLVYFITFPFGPGQSLLDLCSIHLDRYGCDLALREGHGNRI